MENAADALKMAAAVLVFVMALSISINAFGQARKTAQTILEYKDREYDYTYINDDESDNTKTKRIVSAETIIPSIYKAYKENYKIVFDFKDKKPLYKKTDGTEVHAIDLQYDVAGGSYETKETYFKVLVYGPNRVFVGSDKDKEIKRFQNTYEINLLNFNPIYDRIIKEGTKKFEEEIGVYYQEELSDSEAPDANKVKKRVVTYTEM